MTEESDTIAGLPVEKFLNRRVRLTNKYAGHKRPATLLAITGKGKVEVKPDSHRGTDIVDIENVHPWWSQNPDLQEEHRILVAESKVEPLEDDPDDPEEADAAAVKMPKMEVAAGADITKWYAKVNELHASLKDEADVVSMLEPIRKRKKLIVGELAELGVKVTD